MDHFASYAVVEFPGALRQPENPRYAIAALGGENAVRSINRLPFGNGNRGVTLNLRLGLGASPSNIASENYSPESKMFVLRVIEDLPDDQGKGSPRDQPNHPIRAKPRVSHFSSAVLGQVTSVTSFRSIADYQFHPRKLIQMARMSAVSTPFRRFKTPAEVASEALFPVAKRLCKEPRENGIDHLIDRLRPTRFWRIPLEYGDTDYWYRQFRGNFESCHANPQTSRPANRALIEDRRSDTKRLEGLFHRVKLDVDQVPTSPHPSNNLPSVRGRGSVTTLQALIDKLFKIRPVWIRRALLEGIPMNLRSCFKRVVVNSGYCFQGPGPFYLAWIRYGYDPRKDPNARKYQVFQVRINHPVIIEAAELQKQEMHDLSKEIHYENDLEAQTKHDRKPDKPEQQFKLPSAYQLTPDLPLRKNNFAQLCDINLPEVEEFCKRTQPEQTFDKKFGFFTESSHDELMVTIRKSLVRIGTEIIGQHRLPHLLQDYKKYPNGAMRQRRKRIRLKSVISPKSSLHTHQESEIDDVRQGLDSSRSQQMLELGIASPDHAPIEMQRTRGSEGVPQVGSTETGQAISHETAAGGHGSLLDLANLDVVKAFDILGANDEDSIDSDDFGNEQVGEI